MLSSEHPVSVIRGQLLIIIPDVEKVRVEMSTSGKQTVEDARVPLDMEGR